METTTGTPEQFLAKSSNPAGPRMLSNLRFYGAPRTAGAKLTSGLRFKVARFLHQLDTN